MSKNNLISTDNFKNKKKNKSKKEMIKEMSFTLKNDVKCRKFTSSEIGRGIGIIKPKKGKGSYNRKNRNNSYDYFFVLLH